MAEGSGEVADTIRWLRAKYSDAAKANPTEGGRVPARVDWPRSVVRDDQNLAALTAADSLLPTGTSGAGV